MTLFSRIIAPFTGPRREYGDPLVWCWAITLGFLVVVLHRLGTPSKIMFDEVHYLPAARRLIALTSRLNPEHPLLGKEMIALGMLVFGDNPWGWRLPNALLGTLGLLAGMRSVWWASLSRSATLLFGLLFATNFIWFVLSRIAMLDMAMASMMALAFWQAALAWRKGSRLHLALCGVFLGLSLGGKWNGAPILALPGLLFAWDRWWALAGRRCGLLWARDAGPIRGISLLEAAVWLGVVPLIAYFATFAPAFFYKMQPLTLRGLIPWQQYMLQLQDSVVKPHLYMSRWWQWVFNIRPIWFFYSPWDGAQRGVLMIGNPFTMLAGLPALLLCLWAGVRQGDRLRGAVVVLYIASLIFWAINGKPVQFYYHYALASVFLMAALALVLAGWWEQGRRWPALFTVVLSAMLFVGFYPILSAAALEGKNSYRDFTWLDSWR
ncbi:phospholipid carrier-dependent glycosyltransferase [Novosphingobium sp. PASSN1]|uniref:phospholipid carrier-dependent glycosyltransferase n=1 Tax=Novosphingobium sp. PASSN1 TaxID=2015561 RepID=UPI000BCD6BF1|nr:phospholipid carrier-dependent glycosyltransferase [Novosphingobium sp. PASSN1]OYU33514.1 MAG: glycosyl transferase [Novosphingobium sp. PASSN1]